MNTLELAGPFAMDKSQSAAQQIYHYLRSAIVRLTFKPGMSLDRAQLASYFGVSVTPVRDALLKLRDDELVDIFPQHGTRVRAVDLESARNVHFLRLSLELEIARMLAGRRDAALVQALRDLVGRQRACLECDDMDAFAQADQGFHERMYIAAGAEQLWRLMRGKSGNMDRLRRLHLLVNGKAESVLDDHAAIVAAIAAGSPDLAETAVREHLGDSLSQLMSLRERYPDYLVGHAEAGAA
ncbi:GntR family transcriptional regulator [Duganella radicis]|uniref:FCD domain-containing protein n=1 Tax=Duganella radicis TaxID=551988 RepID=A0A6L6PPQ6_9BURK|nr:GntR family transcriptional regulator [Duganella radicis]MTV41040.1 FCD domain-containing protein [Duganella radicis]